MKELKALDDAKDPEHTLAMVVYIKDDDASLAATPNKVNLLILKIFNHVKVVLIL